MRSRDETPVGLVRYLAQTYRAGATEQRVGGAGHVQMIRLTGHPPGHFVEPPMPTVTLQIGCGSAVVDLGDGPFHVGIDAKPGFIVAPAGQACEYDIPAPLDLFALELPPWAVRDARTGEPMRFDALHRRSHDDPFVLATAERLWTGAVHGSRLEVDELTVLLVTLLRRCVHVVAPERGRAELSARRLERLRDFVHAHLEHDISLGDLSAAAGMSRFSLCRAFRRAIGLSPLTWVTHQRIAAAKRLLLRASGPTLTEVALAVGYGSQTAFGRAFKTTTGRSPTAWRASASRSDRR